MTLPTLPRTDEVRIDEVRRFWDANPCESALSVMTDRVAYFEEVAARRYALHWHIPLVARFQEFRGKDVLEIGCGIGTDGAQYAAYGARYTGVDLTSTAVELSRERFSLAGLPGRFICANGQTLPFADESFDHIYSYGVIHHSPDTEAIVREMARVLRPSGTICVMIYNHRSIHYVLGIMGLRRLARWTLRPAWMASVVAGLGGVPRERVEDYRRWATRPGMTHREWLALNTDGPGCPLVKVYSAAEAHALFRPYFTQLRTEVWHFHPSHLPGFGRWLPSRLQHWLGRRFGWHRMVYAVKPTA